MLHEYIDCIYSKELLAFSDNSEAIVLLAVCLSCDILKCTSGNLSKILLTKANADVSTIESQLQKFKIVANHLREKCSSYKIYYINTVATCEEVFTSFDSQNVRFIGLDCEWTSKKNHVGYPVALIQLATDNGVCYLIHLAKMNGIVPEKLKSVLEDRHILKFGVGIHGDCERLRRHGIQPRGYVDLRNVLHRCVPSLLSQHFRNTAEGLASLSKLLLGLSMIKSDVQRSNWELDLTKQQIQYAALDGIASLEVFLCLGLGKKHARNINNDLDGLKSEIMIEVDGIQVSKSGSNTSDVYFYDVTKDELSCAPEEIMGVESLQLTKLAEEQLSSICQGLVELGYRQKNKKSKVKITQGVNSSPTKKNKQPSTRRRPLYENCFLLSPDGQTLCTCDAKKIQWYIAKGLAHLEKDEPLTARLVFQPSGYPTEDRMYYTTVKENKCVVCGHEDSYTRKMIVPHDYKRNFPPKYKDRLSHDVQLLCPSCHQISCQYDEDLKRKLAAQYDAPIGTYKTLRTIEDPELRSVKSAAKALLKQNGKLPMQRKQELEKIIIEYTKKELVDLEMVKELSEINTRRKNDDFAATHGEKVVQGVLKDSSVAEFITMWRQHFIDTMQPQFMPKLWSVEHTLMENNDKIQ